MLAFVGPPPEGQEVNHKFGHRKDNRLSELEYMTKKEQQIHARDVLKRKFQHGSKHGRHKLTENEVLQIRYLTKTMPQKKIAERFGVNVPTVSMIVNRRTWRHI
jgi:DNA-binding MarR family transcriptional regulator